MNDVSTTEANQEIPLKNIEETIVHPILDEKKVPSDFLDVSTLVHTNLSEPISNNINQEELTPSQKIHLPIKTEVKKTEVSSGTKNDQPKERRKVTNVFLTILAILGGMLGCIGIFAIAAVGFGSAVPGIALFILLGGIGIVVFFTSLVIFKIWSQNEKAKTDMGKYKRKSRWISFAISIVAILLLVLMAI